MQKIPEAVQKKLDEIRASHKYTVSLSKIKGKFYALETVKKFVKVRNKYVTFSHYLGRILDDGVFVEAKHRKAETTTNSLDRLVEMKMNLLGKSDNDTEISETELKILTSLSTDARRPVADLARELEMSTTSVEYHIKKLENRYDIKYILEIPVTTALQVFKICHYYKVHYTNIQILEKIKAMLT